MLVVGKRFLHTSCGEGERGKAFLCIFFKDCWNYAVITDGVCKCFWWGVRVVGVG